jgi:dTDP-glucose pyrophosphorylase/predicted transcriptional regulator
MKGNIEALLVGERETLRRVLEVLQQGGLGISLVVDSERKLKGTITDGDCRRALLKNSPLDTAAEEVMSKRFILVDESFAPAAVEALMKVNGVRQVPVVDREGRVVGVITDRNLSYNSKRSSNVVLILAGGQGSRLRPLTNILPKPMLPVGGRPMLEHLVARLVESGFHNIFFSVNYKKSIIEEHFKDASKFGCEITFLHEKEPLGTAGPLALIRDKITAPVIVANGDVLTAIDFRAFLDFHSNNEFDMTVGTSTSGIQIPYGVIKTNERGEITEIEEKPIHKLTVNAGLYVISPQVVELIPESGFFLMTELIQRAIDAGKRVGVFPIHETWLDVGRPAEFMDAQAQALVKK